MNIGVSEPFGGTRRVLHAVGFALCIAGIAGRAQAATLNVPAQFATIQDAVSAAAAGDTILLANGTYTGAKNREIDFGGKDLIVKSSGGAVGCIIDCQQTGRAFHLTAGVTAASRIDGLTIKNGNVTTFGGGIYADGSNPTVTNCTFTNNTAYVPGSGSTGRPFGFGGGISGGIVTNCTFTGNTGGGGGGTYNSTAINCTFTSNTATAGGGMYGGTATGCTFTGNTALNSGGGMNGGNVTNCTFTGNTAATGGGGMAGGAATNCTFTGNTSSFIGGGMSGGNAIGCIFTNNTANTSAGNSGVSGGGGIYGGSAIDCFLFSNTAKVNGGGSYNTTLLNCTVVGNTAQGNFGGGIYNTGSATITNSIIWGNKAAANAGIKNDGGTLTVTYSDVQDGYAGAGNLNADPLFVNLAAGDLHLTASSPCVDAGIASDSLPATDLDGKKRVVGTPDLGAYEYGTRVPVGTNTDYATGAGPVSVALADVNGDGKPDIVTANFSASTVSVLFGKGDGSFGAKTDYVVGPGPHGVAVADLNHDGRPDIVTANYSNNTVSVLLGNGDGTFGPKKDYQVGYGPFALALADVNGDGLLDVVTVNILGYSMTVLLNTGNGTLGPYTNYDVGASPRSIALADVNGDGKPDVVIANSGSTTVSVFFNNGSGLFGGRADYAVGTAPSCVTVGDVNGDGKPDIVAASYAAAGSTVSVLFNSGTGTFGARTAYPVGANPQSVVLADTNGDGLPDIVAANYGVYNGSTYVGGNSVSVLLGAGGGTFGAASIYPGGSGTLAATVGDVSGEGRLDIVTANNGSNTMGVLLNQGSGGNTVSGVLTLDGVASKAIAQNLTFAFRPVGGGTTITKTQYVLPGGAFSFAGLPAANYTLRIKGEKYLAVTTSAFVMNGSVTNVAATLKAGDGTNDNVVDIGDFGLLVNGYNADISLPGSGYDYRADFNGDGVIDIGDFGLLVNNYNAVGAP